MCARCLRLERAQPFWTGGFKSFGTVSLGLSLLGRFGIIGKSEQFQSPQLIVIQLFTDLR
jgi:hypothetical protein